MNVVTGAKRIVYIQRALTDTIRQDLSALAAEANAVASHTADENAKTTIHALLAKILAIREIFLDMNDSDTSELLATILAEELHFRKSGRKNMKARFYQEKARRRQGVQERIQAEMPTPHAVLASLELAPKSNYEQTPEYERVTKEIRDKYWPDASAQGAKEQPEAQDYSPTTSDQNIIAEPLRPLQKKSILAYELGPIVDRRHLPIDQVIALERKENEKLFGPMDLDARCEQELEIMRAKANVKPQTVDSAPISSVKAVEMGGASYAPGVLRTSVPPTSEMLEADVTEGKDVL